jgi:FMN-dependent NADH-azoreductase
MMRILHVDASARIEGSHSRELSRHFVEALHGRIPRSRSTGSIWRRTRHAISGLSRPPRSRCPEADHTPEMREAIADSDAIVARVLAADALVIGTPIYNFGMPSTLKAFFDHVSRNGKTFLADETGMRGLIGHKRVAVLIPLAGLTGRERCSTGSTRSPPMSARSWAFLGIADPAFIAARPMMFAGQDAAAAAMISAQAEADELASKWGRPGRM